MSAFHGNDHFYHCQNSADSGNYGEKSGGVEESIATLLLLNGTAEVGSALEGVIQPCDDVGGGSLTNWASLTKCQVKLLMHISTEILRRKSLQDGIWVISRGAM